MSYGSCFFMHFRMKLFTHEKSIANRLIDGLELRPLVSKLLRHIPCALQRTRGELSKLEDPLGRTQHRIMRLFLTGKNTSEMNQEAAWMSLPGNPADSPPIMV